MSSSQLNTGQLSSTSMVNDIAGRQEITQRVPLQYPPLDPSLQGEESLAPTLSAQSVYGLWQQQVGRLSSLRWRLTMMLGFVLLCTLLVISLIVATFVRNTEANTWLERQKEAADYASQSVSNLVVQVSATLNLINTFELNELQRESDILRNIMRNHASLTEVAYFNGRGAIVASATLDNLQLLTDTALVIAPQVKEVITTPYTASNNTDNTQVRDNYRSIDETPWFVAAQQNKLFFDVVQFSITQGQQMQPQYLLFAMPAANQSVIVARIQLRALYQTIGDIRFGSSGRSYVVNQYGDIIARSDQPVLDRRLSIQNRSELMAAINRNTSWFGSYTNFEETHVMGVAKPIPNVKWLVVAEVDRSEIFANSRRAYMVLGGGMFAFVILMMWASAEWMEGLILTPIERLRDGAERIGRGDLTHHIDALHQDEIGQVALAFNHMAMELKDLYDDLEQKIAERTELLEEQAEELARSNAELAQFAYIASHDLQEPLRMISNYLQLIDRRYRGQLDADADEFIDYAVDGAIRMQQLIRDLLAYSRVGTRGQAFSRVNLHQIVSQVMDDLQVMIHDTSAVIHVNPLPQIIGDATQLGQLFQNLLSNALKFSQKENPLIEIGATYDTSKREWLITVSDNGIGIEPEYFERIFLIFQRLHTRSEYPGTGIGLAICKKIVERHGGQIWVESGVAQGTTFYFTIPTEAIDYDDTEWHDTEWHDTEIARREEVNNTSQPHEQIEVATARKRTVFQNI